MKWMCQTSRTDPQNSDSTESWIRFVRRYSACLLAGFALLLAASSEGAEPAQAERHSWGSIDYPPIPIPDSATEQLMVKVDGVSP